MTSLQRQYREANPTDYGYGPERMKQTKVCTKCFSLQPAALYLCSQCGERLPQQTLFERYQAKNKLCPVCDTVLSDYMKFCPHCGKKR